MKLILNTLVAGSLLLMSCGAAQAAMFSPVPTAPSDIWDNPDPQLFDPNRGANSNDPNWYDWGDAVGYENTRNKKGKWQGLGEVNGIDDGVMWSVAGSDFGTDADLIIGEEVTFRFLFWQSNNGHHTYDQILAFFDFNQDNFWEPAETLMYEQIDTINNLTPGHPENDDNSRELSRYLEFELTFTVPDTMQVGSTWLRSRVHCNHHQYGQITPYNRIAQGETEDYYLNIVANPVPEPTTMLLFGTGLLGLAGLRARRKK